MSKRNPGDLPDDLGDLARRYVDLWQDQMTALATDPEFAESLRKVMDSLGPASGGLQAVWASWPAAMTSLMAAAQPRSDMEGQKTDGVPDGRLGKDSSGSATPGTAAAAAAPRGGGPDLGDLEERLAALEQRVLALEGRTGRTRSSPKRKSRKS